MLFRWVTRDTTRIPGVVDQPSQLANEVEAGERHSYTAESWNNSQTPAS